ncbi:hypothetical protein KKA93_02070 [Patescibacteria group bacterium]|nr:hypothetical protein [Patescibacteria group bacterium]MBU1663356.1 hypothetical protein [Patescibacteria group bacterium]MBU1934355.1 hypothetical protein [Patescibacteria group bacterium]MBU2007921.1 hypothetical protein [Patescibacteria group bacterium]MBU2233712.1 hypothetical protein [Patescibacteria group bacterium]
MADIKLKITADKILSLDEQPLSDGEKLKQKLEDINKDESKDNFKEVREQFKIEQAVSAAPMPVIGPTVGVMEPQAKQQKQVESILAEDLAEIYLSLAPSKRLEFKIKGEQTANKINQLLTKTKINISKIIKLIKKWLSLIPGMNKYFLEQEAKIKADEIVKIKN